MQTDFWAYQDDITKSLNVEKYIQSHYDEIKPRNINNHNKKSAMINDISIEFTKNNEPNTLIIKIIHNGETYVSKNLLTKKI